MADPLTNFTAEATKASESAKSFSKDLQTLATQAIKVGSSLEGLAGIIGGVIAADAVKATVQYNRSLYDLSRSASVTGRSFGEMQVAIKQLSDSTSLAENEAANLYKTINDGISGVRLSASATRELAKAIADEFGPSLEQANAAAKELLDINKRMPGTFATIRSSLPYKEYEKLIDAKLALGKLTVQEAEDLLRAKKSYEGLGDAAKKQRDELRKLEDVQQQLNKQFQTFMLAVGKPLAGILANLGKAVAPFLDKMNQFLKDPKSQEFISLLLKGAAIKFGLDIAASPFEKMKGMMGGLKGGGSLASSIMGEKPVNVIIVEDRSQLAPGAGGGTSSALGGGGGRLGRLGGFLGSKAMGPLGAMGAMGLSGLANSLGRGTTGGALASGGSYALAGSSAVGMLGGSPQMAAVTAAFLGAGEAATQLGKKFGIIGDETESFGDTLHSAWLFLKDKAIGAAGGKSNDLQAKEIGKAVTAEQIRRGSALAKFNEKNIEEAFGKLSNEQKERLGFGGEGGAALFKANITEKFGAGGLERGIQSGDIEGAVSDMQKNQERGFLAEQAGMREDQLKNIEAQNAALEVSRNYALQYGGSMDKVKASIESSVANLNKQTGILKEQLKYVEQEEKTAREAANAAKTDGEKLAAERQLEQILASKADINGKIAAQDAKILGTKLETVHQAEAEIAAWDKQLNNAVRFGASQQKIASIIKEENALYNIQLDTFNKEIEAKQREYQTASPEKRKELESQINRFVAQRSEIINQQADANMRINDGLKKQRDVMESHIGALESELALSESLYGGLGQSLEIRAKIYDELEATVKKTEEMIKNQQQLAAGGDQDAQIRLNSLYQERTNLLKKQVELTKSLRDGYLDALTTFTNVEGTFSKIIVTREQNLGAAIRKGFAAGSMTTGVMGAGAESPIAKFTAGGGINIQNQKQLGNLYKGYESAYDQNAPWKLPTSGAGAGKGTYMEDVRTAPPGYGPTGGGQNTANQNLRNLATMRGLVTPQEEAMRGPGGGGGVMDSILDVVKRIFDALTGVSTNQEKGVKASEKAAQAQVRQQAAQEETVRRASSPLAAGGAGSATAATSGQAYVAAVISENQAKQAAWSRGAGMDKIMSGVNTGSALGASKGTYAEGIYNAPKSGGSRGSGVSMTINVKGDNAQALKNMVAKQTNEAIDNMMVENGSTGRVDDDTWNTA